MISCMVLLRNPTLVVKALCAEPDQLGQARILGDLADLPQHAVEAVLEGITLSDVREGEVALTDLWFALQEKRIARAEGIAIDDALKQREAR